jgi:hypothetical protein
LLQNLPNLERIDLNGSNKLIKCPNMSGSPNLRRVRLENCESLLEVDSSIFLLQKLQSLKVSGCRSLKSLSSLQELYAGCINLQEFSVTFTSVDRLQFGFIRLGLEWTSIINIESKKSWNLLLSYDWMSCESSWKIFKSYLPWVSTELWKWPFHHHP